MPDYLPYLTFLLAGLAGSLHCLGMCGPILILLMGGQRNTKAQLTEVELKGETSKAVPYWDRDVTRLSMYHVGRIWTYMLLGLIVGIIAAGLRQQLASRSELALIHEWQRTLGLIMSGLVILAALLMTGLLPTIWNRLMPGSLAALRMPDFSEKLHTCTYKLFGGKGWFKHLVGMRHPGSRLLLGAAMGFLPCGLVYSVLLLAMSLPTPLHSALAMLVFGIGTLPALSSLVLSLKWLPISKFPKLSIFVKRHGNQLAGAALLLTGLWMGWRAWQLSPEKPCPNCSPEHEVFLDTPSPPVGLGHLYGTSVAFALHPQMEGCS